MRAEEELVRAHDLLVGVLTGEAPNPFENEESARDLNIAAGVLCWVLEHDHNPAFMINLSALEVALEARGYKLCKPQEN